MGVSTLLEILARRRSVARSQERSIRVSTLLEILAAEATYGHLTRSDVVSTLLEILVSRTVKFKVPGWAFTVFQPFLRF